jgi:hypothetical protein
VYVNHRPAFGVGRQQLQRAFDTLLKGEEHVELVELFERLKMEGKEQKRKREKNPTTKLRADLFAGEKISEDEMEECLESLLGSDFQDKLDVQVDAQTFAEYVLGFQT